MISIEVRSEKDVKKGMTDALFWAGYLKDKEEEIDLFGSLPKGFKKKGGEGSGHHGHGGLPGVWGGSAPSGRAPAKKPKAPKKKPSEDELSPEDIAAQEHHAAEKQKREKLLEAMENTRIVSKGGDEFDEYDRMMLMEYTDFDEDDLKYMFALPGARTIIEVNELKENAVLIETMWYDADDEVLGRAVREFKHFNGVCYNHSLKFEEEWQDRDLATSLYERQKERMAEWSYDEIHLEANITIGRYSWAKEGFKYKDPGRVDFAKINLGHWLADHGMGDLAKQYEDKINTFIDPYDFATFDVPGFMVKGSQITNEAVKPDYMMHIGKAFMLDRRGFSHGSWNGKYKL